MSVINIGLLSFTLQLLAVSAFAVPTLYSRCPDVQIQQPPLSSGYFFSRDCKTAYVLPPRKGQMRVSHFQTTGAITQTCQRIQSIEDTYNQFTSTENALSRQMSRNAKRIEELDSYLDIGLYPIGMSVDDIIDEIMRLSDQSAHFRERIMDFHEDYVTRMEFFANREGGRGRFTISSGYNDLVQSFENSNPEWSGEFRPLPLSQSYLAIVQRGINSESQAQQMAAVLSLEVPGLNHSLPLLEGSQAILNESRDNRSLNSNGNNFIFGATLGGSIRLSQVGVCSPSMKNQSHSFSMKDLKSDIVANSFFEYQVQVHRNHSMTFKMDQLIQILHEQTRRSGFFSRRTFNRLIDERQTSSWVEFHAESEDRRFEYTDEYVREVKGELIDRALRQIVATLSDGEVSALALINPEGATGSDTLAYELGNCSHLYCQIGQSGLRVLSQIFGSRQASSNLINSFSGEILETVSENRMIPLVGSFTFE